MVMKRSIATTAVASFGAAMTTMYAAPELQADIVDLTFSPTVISYGGLNYIGINEIGVSFSQWNDSIGATVQEGGLDGGVFAAQYSQSIAAGGSGSSLIFNGAGLSGEFFVGFFHQGNAGWFSYEQIAGGTITYTGGEYGTQGETVHVGGTVPEPTGATALAALALGAIGVRRNRKKKK